MERTEILGHESQLRRRTRRMDDEPLRPYHSIVDNFDETGSASLGARITRFIACFIDFKPFMTTADNVFINRTPYSIWFILQPNNLDIFVVTAWERALADLKDQTR